MVGDADVVGFDGEQQSPFDGVWSFGQCADGQELVHDGGGPGPHGVL